MSTTTETFDVQKEIDRIQKDCENYVNSQPMYDDNTPAAYTAGATSEAIRGREQMARFAEWVDDNDFRQKSKGIWENLNGTSRTTAELLDLFLDTQKKKG